MNTYYKVYIHLYVHVLVVDNVKSTLQKLRVVKFGTMGFVTRHTYRVKNKILHRRILIFPFVFLYVTYTNHSEPLVSIHF